MSATDGNNLGIDARPRGPNAGGQAGVELVLNSQRGHVVVLVRGSRLVGEALERAAELQVRIDHVEDGDAYSVEQIPRMMNVRSRTVRIARQARRPG